MDEFECLAFELEQTMLKYAPPTAKPRDRGRRREATREAWLEIKRLRASSRTYRAPLDGKNHERFKQARLSA